MTFIIWQTTVRLSFPNIDKEFEYSYNLDDPNTDCVEKAMRQWYDEWAGLYFALYPYGPMDVHVLTDGRETASMSLCYQETLWHSFFREGGESWHGRFSHFSVSLILYRSREEQRNQQLKAA